MDTIYFKKSNRDIIILIEVTKGTLQIYDECLAHLT